MDSGFKERRRVNPRTTANWLSLITFWWLHDIFKLGYKRDLKTEDLYDALDEHRSDFMGDKLEKMWLQEVQQMKIQKKRPSLFRVLIRCFGGTALWLGLTLAISEFVFQMTQPIFLGGLIRYFSAESDMNHDTAYLYAAGVVVCSTFIVLIETPVWLAALHAGMKMRVGTCSLIYRKSLRLTKTALQETSVGQAVNLLSNDVARLDRALVFLPFLFIGPVQTALIVNFMWKKIGISAVIGAACILLLIPLQEDDINITPAHS